MEPGTLQRGVANSGQGGEMTELRRLAVLGRDAPLPEAQTHQEKAGTAHKPFSYRAFLKQYLMQTRLTWFCNAANLLLSV